MSEQRQAVPPGILFLALTRPPIMPILGLPHGLALIFIVAGSETVILTQGFFALILMVPLWAIATVFIRNDYNSMHVLAIAIQSKFKSWDIHRWGGGSLSPFPVRLRSPRGIV